MVIALLLTGSYTVAEAVGGRLSGSLALLADAGHMLSDTIALGLAVLASWVATRPTSAQRTFGLQRTEILAALVNGATLLAIALSIVVEAVARLSAPSPLAPKLMMAVAAGGLVNNLLCLAILHAGREESLNTRGAWLHVLGDALGSVGALASGALVLAFGWTWADPVASALIAVLIARSSYALLRETVGVLMEHAPAHVDVDAVREALVGHPKVEEVHDLHVWTITSGLVCLSAHVVARTTAEEQRDTLASLTTLLRDRFGIEHVTIQIEHAAFPVLLCGSCD